MKKRVKKDGKKKSGRKPRSRAVSNLNAAIKRGLGPNRTTGMAVPYVPFVGTSHEKLKAMMARISGRPAAGETTDMRRITSIDYDKRTLTYDEPTASAPGAYTRPARW